MEEEKLLQLLQKKRGFFETILELTEEEKHLPVEEWLIGLKQKKVLLSCIDKIDKELSSFKASLEILSHDVHEEIEKIKDLIQEILYIDQINQEKRKKELKIHENA